MLRDDTMRITHLTASDFVRQPWKNGGGMTTEIARQDADGRLLWRVSVASVESSGPFSEFRGLDRTILLLKGAGMELTFDAAPALRIDRAGVPHAFAGEWKTACRLIDGPVEDFNLMVDRERTRATLQVIDLGPFARDISGCGVESLIYAWEGSVGVAAAGSEWRLNAGEALRCEWSAAGLSSPSVALRADEASSRLIFIDIALQSDEA